MLAVASASTVDYLGVVTEEATGEAEVGWATPLAPSGEPLTDGHRVTLREARTWLRRERVAVGRLPECSQKVQWLEGADRQEFVSRLRHSEGRDCNVGGDVLLYMLCDGGRVAVVEVE
jgi:hypothetical protein